MGIWERKWGCCDPGSWKTHSDLPQVNFFHILSSPNSLDFVSGWIASEICVKHEAKPDLTDSIGKDIITNPFRFRQFTNHKDSERRKGSQRYGLPWPWSRAALKQKGPNNCNTDNRTPYCWGAHSRLPSIVFIACSCALREQGRKPLTHQNPGEGKKLCYPKWKDVLLSHGWVIVYIYTHPHLLYPFICWWTLKIGRASCRERV